LGKWRNGAPGDTPADGRRRGFEWPSDRHNHVNLVAVIQDLATRPPQAITDLMRVKWVRIERKAERRSVPTHPLSHRVAHRLAVGLPQNDEEVCHQFGSLRDWLFGLVAALYLEKLLSFVVQDHTREPGSAKVRETVR
jgi:hypothetical protein